MKNSLLIEGDLIELARWRDESAFARLLEAYMPVLYRVVRRMTRDTLEAEAIVQDAFWRFWNVLPRYKAERPLSPYLVTIASNLARDRYRRERRTVYVDAEIVLERSSRHDINLEERVDQKEVLKILTEAVDSLPFAYREVITLSYDGEMSYEEIAAVLSLPWNTGRTYLRRAKQVLRKRIEEEDHG
jgi:RNA polymerase sigma-70 factor (ECF subfamily)